IGIERSKLMAELAKANLAQVSSKATVVNAPFVQGLDLVLPELLAPLDLVLLDGHPDTEATTYYVDRVAPYMADGGVLVLDDLAYNDGIRTVLSALRRRPGVTWTVDAGRFGVCVWERAAPGPRHYDLSKFTGLFMAAWRPSGHWTGEADRIVEFLTSLRLLP